MTETSSFWSPTAWLNSAHVEHWLRGIWPSWRMADVRHAWDSTGRWYWIVPDYDHGRSRVLGIPRALLERTTLSKLREVLEAANWLDRIEQEPLLVEYSAGEWSVSTWDPDIEETWFEDPGGGYFLALRDPNPYAGAAPPPVELPAPFLALHGKTWSARGPENPRSPTDYELPELLPFLPTQKNATP